MSDAARLLLLVALACATACARLPSPYAGQQDREIKALSAQELADYRAGHGMGLAKAAELNGYPGPAHVLELAKPLDLTADQKARTEAVFRRMQARAVDLGSRLIDEERALDAMFASHEATPEPLRAAMARIARLQGELRDTHLQAHLEQAAILTPAQIKRYGELRGYASASGEGHSHTHSH